MNVPSKARDTLAAYAEVDRAFGTAFPFPTTTAPASDWQHRYIYYAIVLKGFGEYTPGIDAEALRSTTKDMPRLTDSARRLKSVLVNMAPPTYSVTSYRSPISRRRQSVIHRPLVEDPSARRNLLAYAYAFYAMTLYGRTKKWRLYSATQFILEKARSKWSLPLYFGEHLPGDDAEWWHIPKSLCEELLDASGTSRLVDELVLQRGEQDEHDLNRRLRNLLANQSQESLREARAFADTALQQFAKSAPQLLTRLRGALQKAHDTVAGMFGSEGLKPAMGDERTNVLFMLMTYAIWHRANPETLCAYTFPTVVRRTPCVLTLGTSSPLDPFNLRSLSYFAKTAFFYPLVSDYATKLATQETSRKLASTMAEIGRVTEHRITNVTKLIRLTVEDISEQDLAAAKSIADELPALFAGTAQESPSVEGVAAAELLKKSLNNIRKSLEHVTGMAHQVDEATNALWNVGSRTACSPTSLQDVLSRVRDDAERLSVTLEVVNGEQIPRVLVDDESLLRCFAELVTNSRKNCRSTNALAFIRIDPLGADDSVVITYSDNGPGIPDTLGKRVFVAKRHARQGQSGRGLPEVSLRLRRMGGSIELLTHSPTSAQFRITLKRADSED